MSAGPQKPRQKKEKKVPQSDLELGDVFAFKLPSGKRRIAVAHSPSAGPGPILGFLSEDVRQGPTLKQIQALALPKPYCSLFGMRKRQHRKKDAAYEHLGTIAVPDEQRTGYSVENIRRLAEILDGLWVRRRRRTAEAGESSTPSSPNRLVR